VLNPIQRHTVFRMEWGDCTIDGNCITVKHERRLWPPKLGEAGEGGCINAKSSMTKYGRGTHCCEVLKYPFMRLGTQSPSEGPNTLVAELMTLVVVFVTVALREEFWLRRHTEKYSRKGGPSRANLCLENDGVEVNGRTRACVGELGGMGTVHKARPTAEQLLEGRSLRLCVSRYRLAVNIDIVSPVTWLFGAKNPNASA
jgi:hypothetical protein